eukprot:1531183-Pyramimonas_sp.AAC.1
MATVIDPQMSAAASSGHVSTEDFERNVKHRVDELTRAREELISKETNPSLAALLRLGFTNEDRT